MYLQMKKTGENYFFSRSSNLVAKFGNLYPGEMSKSSRRINQTWIRQGLKTNCVYIILASHNLDCV